MASGLEDVLVDDRWVGTHGIGRFGREVISRLPEAQRVPRGLRILHPLEPLWLTSVLISRRPRLYFSPGFNPPLRSPVPFVFTVHDLVHLRFPEESSRAKRLYYRLVVRPAVHKAKRVLTVSEFSKAELVSWAGVEADRVVVVGNGVGSVFSQEGPSHQADRPYFLFVGLRRPHKNIGRLLDAFKASGLHHEMRLVFVGPADPWDMDVPHADAWTLRLLRDRGLTEATSFTGPLPDEDLAAYYRGARALVLPSLYEGFGLPALEAMACGAPVLVARAGALPEVVREAGVLFDPLDLDELVHGMRRVVEDGRLREDLGDKGTFRAAKFTWDEVATRVRGILEGRGG